MRKLLILLLLCITTSASGQFFAPNQKPGLGFKVNWAHPLSKGLVGCWLFNEDSGNKVFDLSGNGNTGVFEAGITWGGGIHGSTVVFPAGAVGIIIGTPAAHPSLDVDNITIVAWVKIVHGTTWQHIYGANYDQGAWLSITSNETLAFYTKAEGVAYDSWNDINAAMTVGKWYQIAATYDGQFKNVYINDVLDGTKDTAAKAGPLDIDTAEEIAIGVDIADTYDCLSPISSVIVYDRVLSASEIAQLYREPFCIMQPSFNWVLYGGISIAPSGGQIIFIN